LHGAVAAQEQLLPASLDPTRASVAYLSAGHAGLEAAGIFRIEQRTQALPDAFSPRRSFGALPAVPLAEVTISVRDFSADSALLEASARTQAGSGSARECERHEQTPS